MHQAADPSLRERFSPMVEKNRITTDAMWGQACTGYNIQIPITGATAGYLLEQQQDIISGNEDAVHCVPQEALHVSVMWIIGARQTYADDRDVTWRDIRKSSIERLIEMAVRIKPFVIRFREIIITDAAIIALAHDENSTMRSLRQELAKALPVPRETKNGHEIVHTTLCRFRAPLANPKQLLAKAAEIELSIPFEIQAVDLVHEQVYPSLKLDTLCRANLRGSF